MKFIPGDYICDLNIKFQLRKRLVAEYRVLHSGDIVTVFCEYYDILSRLVISFWHGEAGRNFE